MTEPIKTKYRVGGMDCAACTAKVKGAVSFVGKYEEQLQELAKSKNCKGIICGHIHTPADKRVGDVHYLNSGDWVESMTAVVEHLDRYRMAGHDLEIDEPIFVPLELALHVCVQPDHFRSDVKRALIELFSNRVLRNGQRGLFHPDNFSFGDPVYLSRLYAAAHAVPGVLSVQVTAFRRQDSTDELALQEGRITLGRLEIARLDNDPDFPERGVLNLELHGGK